MDGKNIAIACQGGGSHAAYAAGVLQELLPSLEEGRFKLVGLSGTSGGAICALLAWYGLLEGGSPAARRKLDAFWTSNCAAWPGEQLVNALSQWALQATPFEVQLNPYRFPLAWIAQWAGRWWPFWAGLAGSANFWMRAEYFQLDKLVRAQVDFRLLDAIGKFCSIPRDIKRWVEADVQERMFEGGPQALAPASLKRRLEKRIRNHLDMPARIRQLMAENQFAADAPLSRTLDSWSGLGLSLPSFEGAAAATALRHFSDQMAQVIDEIPQLLIGAVDIETGDFTAFSSERAADDGGISLRSVLASAAVPWIFQAVPIRQDNLQGHAVTHRYWDGLFSQNPPIKNFVSGLVDDRRKPDEIWVAQINPSGYSANDLPRDLADRRNELSGNLSLNQEIGFIDAINKQIEQGKALPGQRYVQVHRIAMDSAAVERAARIPLGLSSKVDRTPSLKNALVEHGRAQARAFLPVRAYLDQAGGGSASQAGFSPFGALQLPASAGSTGSAGQEQPGPRLFVDSMKIAALPGLAYREVTVDWHARGGDAKRQITLEGQVQFAVENGVVTRGELKEVRVADCRLLK